MRTFALFAFQDSGRGNLICAVQAEDDERAALTLGGQLVPPGMDRDDMMIISMRLPPEGEAWSVFRFGFGDVFGKAEEAIEALDEALGTKGNQLFSVANLAGNSDCLVLKEITVFKAARKSEAKTEPMKRPKKKARK